MGFIVITLSEQLAHSAVVLHLKEISEFCRYQLYSFVNTRKCDITVLSG